MNPNNICIRIRSQKHYSLTSAWDWCSASAKVWNKYNLMTNDLHAKYQKYKFYLKTQKSLLILQICCVILDELKTTCCDSCHDKMKRDFIKATAWSCSAFIRQSLGSCRRAVPKCHKTSDAKKDQIVKQLMQMKNVDRSMLSIKWIYKQMKVQMLCVQTLWKRGFNFEATFSSGQSGLTFSFIAQSDVVNATKVPLLLYVPWHYSLKLAFHWILVSFQKHYWRSGLHV